MGGLALFSTESSLMLSILTMGTTSARAAGGSQDSGHHKHAHQSFDRQDVLNL